MKRLLSFETALVVNCFVLAAVLGWLILLNNRQRGESLPPVQTTSYKSGIVSAEGLRTQDTLSPKPVNKQNNPSNQSSPTVNATEPRQERVQPHNPKQRVARKKDSQKHSVQRYCALGECFYF